MIQLFVGHPVSGIRYLPYSSVLDVGWPIPYSWLWRHSYNTRECEG